MVLREGVAVADVGIFHAVQEHVHAADAEHGVVEVERVEEAVVEVRLELRVTEKFRLMPPQIFADRHEEAASAARRVANDVRGHRPDKLHHQLDDVARGAELAVLPGAGDLPEHVFVEVALGVAVLHRHAVNHVHDLGEQRGRGDGEARVLHVVRVGGVVAADVAQEREGVLADDAEHFLSLEMFEARPAEIVVGAFLRVFAFGEDAAFHRALQGGGLVLFQRVEVVQALEEQQVGDLLDDFEGIGDAAGPEGIPEGVNFGADFAGKHCSL